MTLKPIARIDLPEHIQPGGFDHAAIHAGTRWLYVAHTINNSIAMIDCAADRYIASIPGLTGVAGALVSDERNLVFTSNCGENTAGIFTPGDEKNIVKVPVGIRPNGLSFDPQVGLLMAANVGSPDIPGSFTLSLVDIQKREMVHSIPVPGRTRWTIFDAQRNEFFVNIADPAQIVVVDANRPDQVARVMDIPATAAFNVGPDAIQNPVTSCNLDNSPLVHCYNILVIILIQEFAHVLQDHLRYGWLARSDRRRVHFRQRPPLRAGLRQLPARKKPAGAMGGGGAR